MSNRKVEGKSNGRKAVLTVLILVCAAVMVFAVYKIVSIQLNYKQAQDEYSALREMTTVRAGDDSQDESDDSSSEEMQSSSESDEEEGTAQDELTTHGERVGSKKHLKAPITVDHEALLAQNPDYAGWLYIGALNLSYPVMQAEDDEYYLHRTFERSYLFAGSLFINSEAARDFSDPHTLIYGHNMKDGSMFGTLRKMLDEKLFENDPYFWVLTPTGNFRYRIFSLYVCKDTSDTYTLFSGHGEIVEDYIRAMKAKSLADAGEAEYDSNSKVVTLSTCVQAEGPDRFVVQGVTE